MFFFKINIQPEMQMQIVWDTSKAYFRGLAIRYAAKQKREKEQKMKNLIRNLEKEEEKSQKGLNTKRNLYNIKRLKHQIRIIQTEEMERNLKTARQNFFENANKPSRWLVYRLKKERLRNIIDSLNDNQGKKMATFKDMKEILEDVYSLLYKRKDLGEAKQEEYLNINNIMKISIEDKNILEEPIKME